MSKAGRFQDALDEYLWGYSHGLTGEWYPGVLYGKFEDWREVDEIRGHIEELAWSILGEQR